MSDGWRPISEPIVLSPDGTPVYWIEDGDRYKIIPPPLDLPWPEQGCFCASFTGHRVAGESVIKWTELLQ